MLLVFCKAMHILSRFGKTANTEGMKREWSKHASVRYVPARLFFIFGYGTVIRGHCPCRWLLNMIPETQRRCSTYSDKCSVWPTCLSPCILSGCFH